MRAAFATAWTCDPFLVSGIEQTLCLALRRSLTSSMVVSDMGVRNTTRAPFKTNAPLWEQKTERNAARGLDTTAQLEVTGCHVMRCWDTSIRRLWPMPLKSRWRSVLVSRQ